MPTPVPPKEPCYSQKMQRSRTARPLDHLKDTPCCFGEQRFFSPRRLLAPPFFTKPFPCDIPHFVMTGKRPPVGSSPLFSASSVKRYSQKARCFKSSRNFTMSGFWTFGSLMISVIPFLLPMALYFGRRTYHLQHRVNYSAFPWESGRLLLGERGKYKDRPKPRHKKFRQGATLVPPQGRGQCDGGTVCGFPHRV